MDALATLTLSILVSATVSTVVSWLYATHRLRSETPPTDPERLGRVGHIPHYMRDRDGE